MEQHRAHPSGEDRDDAHDRPPRGHGDADADAGERGEERVPEGAHEPADEERRREPLAAVLVVGLPEVEDVLAEREARTDETGVDDAVDDAVELAATEQVDEQDAESLEGLLGDRRQVDRARLERVGPPRLDEELEPEGVEEEGADDGDQGSPQEGEDDVAHRLGLVAVEPEERRHDDEQRDDGHQHGRGERLRRQPLTEDAEQDEQAHEEEGGRDADRQRRAQHRSPGRVAHRTPLLRRPARACARTWCRHVP